MKKVAYVLISIFCSLPLAVSAANLVGEYDETLMGISYTMKVYVDNGRYSVTSIFKDGSRGTESCESYLTARGMELVCKKNSFGDYYILNNKGDLEQHDSKGIIDVLKNKMKSGLNDRYQKSYNKESCFSLGKRYGRCSGLAMKGLTCPPEDDFVIPQRCRNKNDTKKGVESGLRSIW